MFKFVEYTITQEHSGLSIKDYLRNVQGVSGRSLQKLTRAKGIYLNDKRMILDKKLKYKDSLKILILQERLNIIPEKGLNIEILYENNSMVVVNKPAGMLVHPSGQTTRGTLINYLASVYEQDPEVCLHAVHRLDRDTTGCIMFAKNVAAKQLLEKDLQNGNIKRIYWAVVMGDLLAEQGEITDRIDKDPFSANRRVISSFGREAMTKYRLVKSIGENMHLLELELLTGRTHQIRVHLAHVGLPIVGDSMYGIRNPNVKRQMLHSVKMYFNNTQCSENIELLAPMMMDMQQFINNKS